MQLFLGGGTTKGQPFLDCQKLAKNLSWCHKINPRKEVKRRPHNEPNSDITLPHLSPCSYPPWVLASVWTSLQLLVVWYWLALNMTGEWSMCLEQPAECVKQLAKQYFGAGSDKVEWVSH